MEFPFIIDIDCFIFLVKYVSSVKDTETTGMSGICVVNKFLHFVKFLIYML